MPNPRWTNAHPNSLYWTHIAPDPEKRRDYGRWLTRISADVAAVNRWAKEQTTDEARFRR